MSSKTDNEQSDIPKPKKPKSETIREFIAELGQGGISDDVIMELVLGLRQEHPNNDVIIKLSETIDPDYEEDRDENDFPWIVFSISDTAYGINSKYVLSIEILGEITPVVEAPHYCPGITRSRGELIEIADMRALFGLGDYVSAKDEKPDAVFMMIVTELNNIKRGLIVDEILAVEHITRFDDNIVSGKEGTLTSQYIERIARREKSDAPVLILKPERLVTL